MTAARPARTVLIVAMLTVLTIGALLLRAERLAGAEGQVGEDESRLILAASGVMTVGVPRMPSGKLYLRGVVNSYLSAGSMALLGKNDRAARLPNTIFGALFVPLLFLFGRSIGGTVAGFCLAVFAAVHPVLIHWSSNAWMPSLFIVAFVAAAYPLYLGYERDQPRMQVVGAAAAVFAGLVHELGVLLAMSVALTLAVRALRRDFEWLHGRVSMKALGILSISLAVFIALGLLLRAPTLSGPLGEFRHYFGPHLSPKRFNVDFERWRGAYMPIALAALAGVPLLFRSLKSGGLFLYSMIAVTMVTVWLIIDKASERYGLILLPLLALAAVWTITEALRLAAGRVRLTPRAAAVARTVVLLLVFGVSLQGDLRGTVHRYGPPSRTWLTDIRELGYVPGDLVYTGRPEPPAWYLGKVDYWERVDSYARYSYASETGVRHLYTGALRVGSADDVYRMVRSNPGRVLWYIGPPGGPRAFPADVRERLLGAADRRRVTEDGLQLLRINLDAPSLKQD